jgi:hypothetical protein
VAATVFVQSEDVLKISLSQPVELLGELEVGSAEIGLARLKRLG